MSIHHMVRKKELKKKLIEEVKHVWITWLREEKTWGECFAEKCAAPLYKIRTRIQRPSSFRIWRQLPSLPHHQRSKSGGVVHHRAYTYISWRDFHIYYYFSKIRFILILINKNKKIGRWDPLVWAVDYVSALISSTPTRVPSYLQKPSYPFSLSDYFLLKKNYLPRRNE